MSKRFLKFLASTALALLLIANSAFAAKAYYYDWPTKNKSTWKIASLGASKVKLVAEFKHAKKHGTGTKYLPEANSGYTVGGGVVTENYYVFAVYKDEKSETRQTQPTGSKEGQQLWEFNQAFKPWREHTRGQRGHPEKIQSFRLSS